MKGDGFLVLCCACIYSTLHLYPRLNEDAIKQDVCIFHAQMSGKEALMQAQGAQILRNCCAGLHRTKRVIF